MSEAIELTVGGNNKGFVAVLNDSEQKAKSSADKIIKEEERKRKAEEKASDARRRELNGLAGDFAKVTSVSQAFEVALSKVGGGMKAAGLVAIIAAIGKGIYDASVSAVELDLAMQRIARSSLGGVANFGMDKLQGDLDTIKQARVENQKELVGISTDFFKTLSAPLKEAFARTGSAFTGAEVLSPQEREDRLRMAEQKALDRIADKQREVWKIESTRLGGAKEIAEVMAIEAAYAEKIQSAILARNASLQKQLILERDFLKAQAERRQAASLAERVTTGAGAAMRAGDADRALRMSAEEEQRQSNETRAALARFSEMDAQKRLKVSPDDPDLQTQYNVSVRETERVLSENAKWERDISRTKGDAVKSQKAGNEALVAELSGRTALGQIIAKRAANEIAIQVALRAGNKELAEQLRISGELERRQINIQRVMEGGRVMSVSETRLRERQSQVDARVSDITASRLEATEGRTVAAAGRAPRAARIGGVKLRSDALSARIGDQGIIGGAAGFSDLSAATAPRGFEAMKNSSLEMQFKGRMSDIGMTRAERQDRLNQEKEQRVQSGNAKPEEALATIAQILQEWNRG